MTDLEESCLKQNIPGKYSTWNSDCKEEKRIESDDDCCNDDEGEVHDSSSKCITETIPYNFEKQHRHLTGVKGVLADHREAKVIDKINILNEQKCQKERLWRDTEDSTLQPGKISFSLASTKLEKLKQKNDKIDDDASKSSDDEDFEDDEFLLNYQQLRLSELQNNAIPIFGKVQVLFSPQKFSQVIDDTDPRVYCIFHLYDDEVKSCRLVNLYFDKLARDQMNTSRFFMIEASRIQPNFDYIGFPCVLIYKGGAEVANLTPITSMFRKSGRSCDGAKFTFEDVANVLEKICKR